MGNVTLLPVTITLFLCFHYCITLFFKIKLCSRFANQTTFWIVSTIILSSSFEAYLLLLFWARSLIVLDFQITTQIDLIDLSDWSIQISSYLFFSSSGFDSAICYAFIALPTSSLVFWYPFFSLHNTPKFVLVSCYYASFYTMCLILSVL